MLSIPRLETRANSNPETTVKSLKVIVYKSGTLTPYMVKDLSGADVQDINEQPWTDISIALGEGDYKMYMLANMGSAYTVKDEDGNAITWTSVREDKLKTAKITAGVTAITATSMSSNGLPMGCSNEKMKVKESASSEYSEVGTGTIHVSSGSITSVQAELTICVAKVTATVINKSLPNVTLTSLKMNPYSTTSGLVADNSDLTKGSTDIEFSGNYYLYDATTGALGTTASNATAAAANAKGWNWTTTYYVAENLYENRAEAEKTKLNFAFSNATYDASRVIDDKNENAVSGVKRGFAYELEGTLKGKTLDIKVSVKPWVYHKSVQPLE